MARWLHMRMSYVVRETFTFGLPPCNCFLKVIEKLKMTLVHIAVSVPSIYIPIIIFGISVIHLLFLRAHLVDVDRSVCKKAIHRK